LRKAENESVNCERLTKILMVEADLTTAEAIGQVLMERGFEVDLARSVHSAVGAMAGCEYAAVVLDGTPPDGEPWPILELARACPRPTPVMMLLAMGDERVARTAQQYGVDHFFVKGAGLTALLPHMVERAIEQSQEYARLRRSETTLTGLLENIPEVLWSITADSQQLIYISPSCAYVYGYSPEDFARNASLAYEAILPEDRAMAEEVGRQIELTRQPGQAEYRIRRSNGAVRWVRVKTIPALDEAGEIVRYDGITADITEQRCAEKQLLPQLIQAQKVESAGRLAGGVAHDFNNLLTGILGFTALAKRQLGREHPTSQSLDEVERAATRATQLVSQLLACSCPQISRLEPLDLNQLTTED
jgi:PAS domain S-box-containing protein